MEANSAEELCNENQSLSTQENVACVKARLQEEGREARNLIAYSLPLQNWKNPSSVSLNLDKHAKAPQSKESKKLSAEVCRLKRDKRQRSASAGRDPQAGLRARHWGFLFRNLQQAVDEIYQTAEDDESIIECKEAILMLERYASDFYKLIEWLKLKWEYENTSPPQRPTSLTWEIRTSSPAKIFRSERRALTLVEARKVLNFDHFSSSGSNAPKNKSDGVPKQQVVVADGVVPPIIVIEGADETKPTAGNKSTENVSSPSLSTESRPTGSFARAVDDKKDLLDDNLRNEVLIPCEEGNKSSQKLTSNPRVLRSIAETPNLENIPKQPKEVVTHQNGISSQVIPGHCSSNTPSSSHPVTTSHPLPSSPPISSTTTPTPNSPPVVHVHSTLYAAKVKDSDKTTGLVGGSKKAARSSEVSTPTKPDTKPDSKKEATSSSVKEDVVQHFTKEETKQESECRKGDAHQTKNLHPKPGPLVNMNKASQVRKAFNQSRTPIKNHQGAMWKNTSVPSADNKISCTKQQGAGGRLTVRRLAEGKSSYSPPLNRRFSENRTTLQRSSTMGGGGISRYPMERSLTSYPMAKGLVRSSTTLDGAPNTKGLYHPHDPTRGMASLGGKCPSSSSIASSSNTSSSGLSWADKVKGSSNTERENSESQMSLQDDDEEGWEVVRRNRRSHGGSAASLNSQGPPPKISHRSLQKRGSAPLRMQRRFEQPSSAVSLPSLTASLDATEQQQSSSAPHPAKSDAHLEATSVPRKRLSSKGSATETKKMNDKRKLRGNKGAAADSTGSISTSETNLMKVGRDSCCQNGAVGIVTQAAKVSHCEKHKKDAANTKTQNESKLCSKGKSGECGNRKTAAAASTTTPVEVNGKEPPRSEGEDGIHSNYANQSGCSGSEQLASSGRSQPEIKETKGSNICPSPVDQRESSEMDIQPEDRDSDNESEREREEIRCNAEAFECVLKKEEKLKQQIEETERASFEDCDSIEEDGEGDVTIDGEGSQLVGTDGSSELCRSSGSSEMDVRESFYHYDSAFSKLASLNWADEMDALDEIEAVRPPGRVLHIHEKLSSPSRKLPISEKLRRHKEKLAKAQELRGKLIMAKTEKLKDLFRKIDEVNIDKERLLVEKRGLFERKMERAEEKRRSHLQEIVNKAHDEENKAKEIAFINGLEAQNKLHDIMQQHQSHESRLADMAEERCRKQEEKAAKEAAAQERRRALEAERHARMVELCEKRRKRCERIDRQQAERREELLEQAREKARDREERLSALQQAQQAKESELVKKIQQKQEETARRHEENIEQIRQKALESSILKYSRGSDEAPKLRRYETKRMCTLCTSVITSEVYLLSHLCSRRHKEALKELHKRDVSQEESETYNLKFIINAPANIDDPQVTRDKERQKALKKRCRKIRTRMASRGKEFLKDYHPPTLKDLPCKGRMAKALSQIKKVLSNQGSGPWPTADVAVMDKHMLELLRILEKENEDEQRMFASLDGFRHLFAFLELIQKGESGDPCVVPARSLAYCARVIVAACKHSREHCRFLLHSNLIGTVVEHLLRRLQELAADAARSGSSNSLNTVTALPSDPAAAALMELLGQVLQEVSVGGSLEGDHKVDKTDENWSRVQDVVSYCVSLGVADKISWYFSQVQNPVENDPPSAEIILAAMGLLSVLSGKLSSRPQPDDPTQLITTFQVLDACGVVSLLYGLLLHQGGRSPSPPAASLLSPSTLAISAAATAFLHNLAELDLNMFQAILGSEGISLEFRHIASFLLWYCSHWPCEEVLHNVIGLVGFFAANNRENQSIIQSGETPSVLQQLCSLPWHYFSEPRLTNVLFPTLLACCLGNDDNINILQQEMTFEVLEDYMDGNKSSQKPLLRILQSSSNSGNSQVKA